jgi:DNA-binding PadR family transcriptional regulator
MSVRQALLALLAQGPMHGYQLRVEFEERTGTTWPLNIGQVYQTLTRLERDGLVECTGTDDQRQVTYGVTEQGRNQVEFWLASPVPRSQPPRDELAIKVAIAVTLPGIDLGAMIQRQRSATISALRDYTRLKTRQEGAGPESLAWSLVLDSLIFAAEAEVRWLDHTEARVQRAAAEALRSPRLAIPGATSEIKEQQKNPDAQPTKKEITS